MRILALDLGTNIGWAIGEGSSSELNPLSAGTYVLAKDKEITAFRKLRMDRRLDPRAPALYSFLKSHGKPDWIVFEDVLFASTSGQAHLWATWRAVVWIYAAENGIRTECLNTTTLKLVSTGHGGASKEAMGRALVRIDNRFFFIAKGAVAFRPAGGENSQNLTDDAVDAVHLLKWAQKTLANTQPR